MKLKRSKPKTRDGEVCPAYTPRQIRTALESGRMRTTSLGLERWCHRCDEYWPVDTDFWFWQPSSSARISWVCRACYREQTGRLCRADREIMERVRNAG